MTAIALPRSNALDRVLDSMPPHARVTVFRPTPREAAQHEAGHAVVGIALGFQITRFDLHEDDRGGGHCDVTVFGQNAVSEVAFWLAGGLSVNPRARSIADFLAVGGAHDLDELVRYPRASWRTGRELALQVLEARVRVRDALADALADAGQIHPIRVHALARAALANT